MRIPAALAILLLPTLTHAATPEIDACLTRHKTPETAVAACTKAIPVAAPGDLLVKVLTARGYAYYALGEAESALQDFNKAFPMTESAPLLRANVQLERGMIRLKIGKPEEAAADLEAVKTSNPDWAEPHFALGYLKQLKGDDAGAMADYDAAKKIDPMIDGRMAASWGLAAGSRRQREEKCLADPFFMNTDIQESACASLLELATPEERALVLLLLAGARHRKGKSEESLRDFNESIKLSSSNAHAYLGRGAVLASMERLDDALKDFDQAIKLVGDNGNFYEARGAVYARKGDGEKTLKDFDRAVSLKPEDGDTLMTRGQALAAQGRYDAAIRDYNNAAAKPPVLKNPHTGIGCAYFLQGDYHKSISAFDEAIKNRNDDVWAWYGRGLAKQKLGDATGAKADMDFALSKNSGMAQQMADDWGIPPKKK